ncbi:hypothetical protein BJF95_10005 [Rhizobium oryziradicis]|uniref:DUF3592 domain-containing protein n=2 Tax=Rhizobium oryziradicis TaxID=1867956 RepID=A0A1Q8ZTU9_9HYPH|nr:DUF3592 domain-containing protein [Rhizobium oryziradicis]OLP45512.1 hypothetical protein BJF95_10005 [Rhizobium oryziradicis]
MHKSIKLLGYVFAAAGVIMLLCGGAAFYYDGQFEQRALHAQGVVTDLTRKRDSDGDGDLFTAIVQFTDAKGQHQEMADRTSSNPPRFSRGDKVDVMYDPESPSSAVINDIWGRYLVALIFGFLGAIFTILGSIFIIIMRSNDSKIKWLQRFGTPVEADFLHVYLDESVKINGASPFRVVAQGADPATGALTRYESGKIWIDPTARLTGKKLRVLVDPKKPKRHMIDLSTTITPSE